MSTMKTLNIKLSERDLNKYNIKSNEISFDELIEKVKNIIAIEAIDKCHSLAEDSRIDGLSTDDINDEIRQMRNA